MKYKILFFFSIFIFSSNLNAKDIYLSCESIIDNNGGLASIGQQQERLFKSGKSVGTDFRDIPFHKIFEGFGGHGELVNKREELGPALKRAMDSGKPACVNVKAKPVLSPIVSAVASKREKSSIE